MPQPPIDRRAVWRLSWKYARRHRGRLVLLGVILAAELVLQVLAPWPLKVVVDDVLGGSGAPMPAGVRAVFDALPGGASPLGAAAWCVAATIAICAAAAAVALAQTSVSILLGARMTYTLAADLLERLQSLSLRFHARQSVGDSMRRLTSDCGCVATIVRDSVLPAAAAALTLAAMFAIMARMNLPLALLSALVSPVLMILIHRYSDAIDERSVLYADAEGEAYEALERALSSMPVVQAFNLEAATNRRVREAYDTVLRTHVGVTIAQFRLKVLTGLAIAAATAAILWVGAAQVLDGRLTVGGLLVFMAYLASLYAPLDTLVQSSSTARTAFGDARRVLEVLGQTDRVVDSAGATPLPPAGAASFDVRFENVTFGYEPQRPVLRDLSFVAAAGSTVAIVGPTGSGKSTLVSLVPRLFDPWTGRVLIAGQDLRSAKVGSVRQRVAIVLQETFLFPTTIAENIAYGRPDATDSQIRAAARTANADEFISRLPAGYDTVVGQRGSTLSGGERQRLAIARALLLDAPVLILDEPTSALDAHTERSLLDALQRLRAGRTTLVIAHRLSTVRAADTILVLDQCRILEQGSHEQLLRAAGAYARLHALQFGAPAADGRHAQQETST